MDPTADFKAFQDNVTAPLVRITRTTGQIAAEDVQFHRSSNAEVSRSLDAQSSRVLQLANKLLKAVSTDTSVPVPAKLTKTEDIDDNWRSLVDVVDHLLERADSNLDEYSGVIKKLSPAEQAAASALTPYEKRRAEASKDAFGGSALRSLPKPQLLFDKPPDNHSNTPFRPLLRTKPHAIVPLEQRIGEGGKDGWARFSVLGYC